MEAVGKTMIWSVSFTTDPNTPGESDRGQTKSNDMKRNGTLSIIKIRMEMLDENRF